MKQFRDQVETAIARQEPLEAASLLADDIVFHSPVVHRPFEGKAIAAAILRNVSQVFLNFQYDRELSERNESALIFRAQVPGPEGKVFDIEGCDFITTNAEGLISEFTVMVRPLKAAEALLAAMTDRFDQIVADATAPLQKDN